MAMSTSELRALISSQKADALAATQSAQLTLERERNDRYYNGDMEADMPAEEGRSSAISSDVQDTIEGLMPHLMDIFAGSDEVVRFEPVGPEDEAAAQQETDYVNHVFMQQNPGFMVLYGFIKDALLLKNGVVKVLWEERTSEQKETYEDLTDEQFALVAQSVLQSNGELQIIAHTAEQENGAAVHDVTVLQTKKYSQARVIGCPPEEFGIERNARNIRDCNYAFHDVCTKSRAELIAEGYDKEQVMKLPEYTGLTTSETLARDTVYEHQNNSGGTTTNTAAQIVKITEHYCKIDYEGDGKPKLYQVVTGGDDGEIMRRDDKDAVEEFDQIPFAGATPIPVPHRFFGRAIADLVISIQKEKTAMKRGALDNLYLHNNPRVGVAENGAGPNTLDDLLVSRPGGVVRTKTNPNEVIAWQTVPDITGSIYPMLQYLDADLEAKTGLAKQTQGIDANALQNQSATAVAQVFSASQMRIKLIARCLAEGVRDIFSLLHATIMKHGEESQVVRLRNQWVTVDPRNWKTRNDMTIAVGLGNGSKAQQFAQIMALANVQKELIAGGKPHMVMDDKLFNMASEMCKVMGYRNPDRFFCDPSEKNPDGTPKYPPAPPPPDPKVMAIQAQSQADQAEIQMKAALDKQKAQDAAALAQVKAEFDAKIKLIETQMKAMELAQKAKHDQQQHHANMAGTAVDLIATAQKHDMQMAHDQQKHQQSMEIAERKSKEPANG